MGRWWSWQLRSGVSCVREQTESETMKNPLPLSFDTATIPAKGAPDTGEVGVQHIYKTVFESVMSQRLTPGTKLAEAALCDLFKVGRTTVQKALQKLAHDHIVELRPNRGAIVAMPTPEETSEIFEARRVLEAAILRLAVEKATSNDIARLRRQLEEEHAVMHTFRQTEWARLATLFHLQIA